MDHVEIALKLRRNRIEIEASVTRHGRTSVEMEVLTAVSVSALTIYDMCKAIDRTMRITDIHLVKILKR